MLKLLPILFFAAVNISQISIFEIDGIFSNGHINAIQRYVDENDLRESNLFVIQYNASDTSENSVTELQELLKDIKTPKAIWVGPNETIVDAGLLKSFDYVGISPGTTIINKLSNNEFEFLDQEGIYEGYMVVGSIGAFIENLGSENIISNLTSLEGSTPGIVSFDINSDDINEIKFVKPSLYERFYISISNPFFTYLFFALGFALLGLELFAIGPGLMAFIGALLIGFSSMTFTEFGLNYYGLILFLISFVIFIKILARGYFGLLGIAAFSILHISSIVMFMNYQLEINNFLMIFCSAIISFFYFVAIPTVIRSRLTTDTSAMSSFGGSTVKILKMLGDSKALVQFERNNFVVEIQNNQTFQLDQEVEVTEIDGKLSI
jgi:membrane protein implicated in regulation of membrane protease activity|tara:strand:- start:67 stop:1203 length:1137 start_codon:yes stop_codon:yes gene_type:complete